MTTDKEKFLLDVPPKDFLLLLDGKKIKNLYELVGSLKDMSDPVFGYHVNFQKNDFSEWIANVVGEKKLANDVSNSESKHKMAQAIEKRILELKKQIKEAKEKEEKKKTNKGSGSKNKKTKGIKKVQNKKPSKKQEEIKDNLEKQPGLKKENDDRRDSETNKRVDDILRKEREIELREQKIQEIEERIEKRLSEMPDKDDLSKKGSFFSKDFIQGIVVGLLLVALGYLVYLKFFV